MQLTMTTDYAIRIICYLASKQEMISATELAQELKVPVSYIPKVTRQLKKAGLIIATEGTRGGYVLIRKPEEISLHDVISSTETTMAINRCLENDGYCSRNGTDTCQVHKVLADLQNNYNDRLENISIADVIQTKKTKPSGRFSTVIKVDLEKQTCECVYAHSSDFHMDTEKYSNFTEYYLNTFVCEEDHEKLQEFLSYEQMKEQTDDYMEETIHFRRKDLADTGSYIWMETKKCVDKIQHTAILTFHDNEVIPNTVIHMEQEIQKQEQNVEEQYWKMVALLVEVLNHNNLLEKEHQEDISFYTEQVYRQLQKNFPKYEITEEEIINVSHLAPIHDIGKIRVPIEILNKNGKLTVDEMEVVRQHPLTGAEMTLRFPDGVTTEKLNRYSYEICRHHHERYDGNGYPDGLKGDEIPLCAQVVGLVDAYDALISERPYKGRLKQEEAIRMIVNGECGAFSNELLQCFLAAALQTEWRTKTKKA